MLFEQTLNTFVTSRTSQELSKLSSVFNARTTEIVNMTSSEFVLGILQL